jgi:hypothetical protein
MKSVFPGYYQPSEKSFRQLWSEAVFVLDANVLLGVYRYSDATVTQLLNTLKRLQDRLWLPYQAAFEYHRNLAEVIADQQDPYADALKNLRNLRQAFRLETQHPFLPGELQAEVDPIFDRVERALEEGQQERLGLLTTNPLKERLAELFEGKVGSPFSLEQITALFKEGESRYAEKVPPGFMDAAKPIPQRYGDLVLWKQLLERAKGDISVLFITDDVKEDWFHRVSGRSLGPRPELIAEFRTLSSGEFYMYTTAQFLRFANEYLEAGVPAAAIEEVASNRPPALKIHPHAVGLLRRALIQANLRNVLQDISLRVTFLSDADAEGRQFGTLSDGRKFMVPKGNSRQLVVYRKTEQGWVVEFLGTGYEEPLTSFIGTVVSPAVQAQLDAIPTPEDETDEDSFRLSV